MNILIGLTIIFVLMLSESASPGQPAIGFVWSVFGMLLCTSIAPTVAAVQVFVMGRKLRLESSANQQKLARWLFISHTAIWMISSLLIVSVLKWQDIVRIDLKIDQAPLLDEVLILAPALVSLIVSWFVFFELQKSTLDASEVARARYQYVSIRCRIYLLLTLIPVLVLVAIKDLWHVVDRLPPVLSGMLVLGIVVILLCLMPVLIGLLWTNRPISIDEGREELLDLCAAHKMRISDIRIWDTGNQVVNAVVAGIVPNFRMLMVSDLLLESFPDHELRAILRHEAGHVRLRHLPIRIGFILLPALALAALELDPEKTLYTVCNALVVESGMPGNLSLLIGSAFLVYVVLITAWLSKNMELEADLYAIGACAPAGNLAPGVSKEFARSMSDALLRFAQQNPDQIARRSLTHPSLLDRIEMIRTANENPDVAARFRLRFSILQCLIAACILAATILLLVI